MVDVPASPLETPLLLGVLGSPLYISGSFYSISFYLTPNASLSSCLFQYSLLFLKND